MKIGDIVFYNEMKVIVVAERTDNNHDDFIGEVMDNERGTGWTRDSCDDHYLFNYKSQYTNTYLYVSDDSTTLIKSVDTNYQIY